MTELFEHRLRPGVYRLALVRDRTARLYLARRDGDRGWTVTDDGGSVVAEGETFGGVKDFVRRVAK